MRGRDLAGAAVEHDAVRANGWGRIWPVATALMDRRRSPIPAQSTLGNSANSETGVLQDLPAGLALSDMTQAFGKIPVELCRLRCAHPSAPLGPQAGRAERRRCLGVAARAGGASADQGRRAGNGPALRAPRMSSASPVLAQRPKRRRGMWRQWPLGRNCPIARYSGSTLLRLPITRLFLSGKVRPGFPTRSCMMTPGWKGETQVMQMDLSGFAISAGSACSSGKVRASTVLAGHGL